MERFECTSTTFQSAPRTFCRDCRQPTSHMLTLAPLPPSPLPFVRPLVCSPHYPLPPPSLLSSLPHFFAFSSEDTMSGKSRWKKAIRRARKARSIFRPTATVFSLVTSSCDRARS